MSRSESVSDQSLIIEIIEELFETWPSAEMEGKFLHN